MTNWSPFLSSDGMDAWFSGSWPDQQVQTNSLAPHPGLQSSHPFLPPLLNSLSAFHSTLGSPTHRLGRLTSLGRTAAASPAYRTAPGIGGQSPFTAAQAVSTSSQLARRRRRDGPSLALSHNPSTDPYRPFRPTDFVPNTAAATTSTTHSSAATTANSSQTSGQQHNHLPLFPQPSASTAPQTLHNLLTSPLDDFDFLNHNPRPLHHRDPNSDDLLEALATGDLSSPSLPPRSPQSPHQPPSRLQFFDDNPPPRQESDSRPFITAAHQLPDPVTGLYKLEDQGDGDDDLEDDNTLDSPQSDMPPTRKRARAAVAASPNEHDVGPSAPKRPRTYVSQRAATPGRSRITPRPATSRNYTPAPVPVESDDNDLDSLFGGDGDSGKVEVFDLTKSEEEIPKELFQPVKDSSIKLSAFECVICMDAASNLTVTCCGHMFCAQCLHQAMHTELTKKVCPMCRQRLDKPVSKSRPPAKAFFHLELKLRPSKKMGKQPARR
ncbi:hypothetical protein KVR01_008875 [Diaporthe batatas]|uniref:uncharacterized protein n=1 Tax=Diaporthe batatas TaxID=748121 RepID=UPI001D043929|nr:uncharacterized protein KVR01_008875 [Diaporthe batatas]KAG8161888.1 hypothetical protein KVR01_008875 [Diaporthe batatas]